MKNSCSYYSSCWGLSRLLTPVSVFLLLAFSLTVLAEGQEERVSRPMTKQHLLQQREAVMAGGNAEDASTITPEDVEKELNRELPGWRSHLSAQEPRTFWERLLERFSSGTPAQASGGHPRTFLTAAQWQALPERFAKASGQEKAFFDEVLAAAEELVKTPLPLYREPADIVKEKKVTEKVAAAELWQRRVGDDIVLLSLALKLQENPAIKERLKETVLSACHYPSWGRLYTDPSKPAGDLANAHLLRGIALAYDWNPKIWSDEEKGIIRKAIEKHGNVLQEGLYGDRWWANSYKENHNHVDVAALGLSGLVFLDEIPQAAEWLAGAKLNFERVARLGNADGGTDEGVAYWTYGLSFILQFLEGIRPMIAVEPFYNVPFLQNSAHFRRASATPGFNAILPYGDNPGKDFYGPQHLLHALGANYRDGKAQWLAEQMPFAPQGGKDVLVWQALWYDPSLAAQKPEGLDDVLKESGTAATRSGWTKDDYMLAVKFGYTSRNHSKLDAGAIAFSFGDDWLIRAPGYGGMQGVPGYFDRGGMRWDFLANGTQAESTLLIGSPNQRFDEKAQGRLVEAFSTPAWFGIDIDLTQAYANTEAVNRRILHRRGDYILLCDTISLKKDLEVNWLLQVPPEAKMVDEGREVQITAPAGRLSARLLAPPLALTTHQPVSKYHNLKNGWQKPLAATQQGERMHFLALLLPQPAKKSGQAITAEVMEDANSLGATLRGEGWHDRVLFSSEAAPQVLEAGGCKATATVLACRMNEADAPQSWFMLGATEVNLTSWTLRPSTPSALLITPLSPDIWLVESENAELKLDSTGDAGMSMEAWSNSPSDDAKHRFIIWRGDQEEARKAVEKHLASTPR